MSPEVSRLRAVTRQVRLLIDDKLDPAVVVSTLFDIDLDDDQALDIEIKRLRRVVAGATLPSADAGSDADGGDAAVSDSGGDAAALPPPAMEGDSARWEARLELDRARLAFYELPREKRSGLLERHRGRAKASLEAASSRELNEVEAKAEKARKAREQALEAARAAKSAAARLVATEHARLLEISNKQAQFEAGLVKRRRSVKKRQEEWLALQGRVREVLDGSQTKFDRADRLHDDLVNRLMNARDALGQALTALRDGETQVPTAGDDRLINLPAEIERSEVDKVRSDVLRSAEELTDEERELRRDAADELFIEIKTLNAERLALLPRLSDAKRAALTSFGPTGLGQALQELSQVGLVLRYQSEVSVWWVLGLLDSDANRGESALAAIIVVIKWLVPLAAFLWWRRRADSVLGSLKDSLDEEGNPSTGTRRLLKTIDYLRRARKPLEWLLLVIAFVWLLPTEASDQLSVQLVSTTFMWILGGALTVLTIDFLAGHEQDRRARKSQLHSAHIRLRSLRLIGRVVVSFGLILALTSLLVGKGTVYGWVLSVCWLAAVPVGLIILRWWRAVIFERVDLKRKKSRFDQWIVRNQTGWRSFPAALLGGTTLLGVGALRFGRGWIGTFNITRRVLAYLFRREISKKAEEQSKLKFSPLDAERLRTLGPSRPSPEFVPSVADAQIDDVIERIDAPGGGVFAIVGERGGGKTTILQRIAKEADDVTLVRCPFGGIEEFAPVLLEALGGPLEARLEEVAEEFDREGRDRGAIVIDDAHRLILPMMGGMRTFDRVLAIARRFSRNVAWVFAFDEVIWRFFENMRGAQPLFDEVIRLKPWDEEAIVQLLTSRSAEAEVDPSFEHLVKELPEDADDIDYEEALEQTEAKYHRLIWDYAAGNPGVALHTWRDCLGVDESGKVLVKVFDAPSAASLEKLPDSAVFVLRALVQLERATSDDVCRATGIPADEVEDALRFGVVRGYLRKVNNTYGVRWAWFRAITRFLQRKHLLFKVE